MRAFLSSLSALLCGFLFIGAMGSNAPIMQSQSYYINDHAGVMEQENRENMLKIAQELYEKTGVRAVLLTIENLDGRTPEEYAEIIFKSWEIGSGGTGILILFSTEEKRFVTWSNSDISLVHSIEAADKLADEEQFDSAANICFMSIVDNIYNKYTIKTDEMPQIVDSEASVIDKQESQISQDTKMAQVTESTVRAESKEKVFFAVIFMLFVLFFMRMARKGSKRGKKAVENAEHYLRNIYSPDEPIAVRIDDVDYPSGFGGLGNRKAIYLEDVDAADDIGIIKRRNSDRTDAEEQERR